MRSPAFDAPLDVAEVLAGPANDAGDLLLVLPGVHGLDDEGFPLLFEAPYLRGLADQSGHHRRVFTCQQDPTCHTPDSSSDQRVFNLTSPDVPAKILCIRLTRPRLSFLGRDRGRAALHLARKERNRMLDVQMAPANGSGITRVERHPYYGLSVEVAPRHWINARSNGSGRGWRVEESHHGLTIHIPSTTREHAYQVVAEMAGLTEQTEAAAA